MNKKLVLNVMGKLLIALGLILLAPAVVSLIYKENEAFYFILTSVISFALGFVINLFTKNKNKVMYAKEGFVVVALAWVVTSVIGALPFYLSGEIPSYVDALFETISGFTTTGASIITDISAISHGMIFWRSLTHWIGGMGVLVFILAFVSSISDRSIHILRAEMPGPIVGKIVPRSKDTSFVLYLIYFVMTIVEAILLWCGDMDLFESLVHSFATAGTGGFGMKSDSLGSYSPYSQWVITIFMFLFGVNFNLYYLILIKKIKTAIKSTELKVYVGMVIVSGILIGINVSGLYDTIAETARHAGLQVVSIITTTGFASVDFNLWPSFSKAIIFILLFSGACAGSTAGGLKISRTILLFKMISKEIKRMVHPRSVASVKFEDKEVDETTQKNVALYFAVYIICILAFFLLISFEPFGMEANFTAALTCFNNVGPGFAEVGPMGSYAGYSDFSKIILSLSMLLGRLEVFPMLILLTPSTWKRK